MIWEALRNLFAGAPADADGSSPRQLVLFCDGTGNSITGGSRDTNVLKLYQSLLDFADARDDLLLYYDPGVGSPDQLPATGLVDQLHRTWERVVGLAEGGGIFDNVSQGYAFLMRNYRPGDRIFIFGFSRGAFTARAIAGLVQLVGIMNEDAEQLLPLLARVYFSSAGNPARKSVTQKAMGKLKEQLGARKVTRQMLADQIKRDFTSGERQDASIHFIGVWDTVDSVGLPGLRKRITSLPTARDKPGFIHVRQALSLDEHRAAFKPRVYIDEDYDFVDTGRPGVRRSLKQRWFAGAHSDVGGGYGAAQAALSAEALEWIVEEACRLGLGHDAVEGFMDPALLMWRIERRTPASAGAVRVRHDEVVETPWWALAGMTIRLPGPVAAAVPFPYAPPPAALPRVDVARALYTLAVVAIAVWGLQTALGGRGFASLFDFATNFDALTRYASRLADIVRLDFGPRPAAGCCARDVVVAPWTFWQALSATGDFGWALFWEIVLVVGIGYFLAIATGRAFVRWAGAAMPGTRPSRWKVFGFAPALAILVGCLKGVAWLLALLLAALGLKAFAAALFLVGVVAIFVALAGWIGCGVLVLMGLARRPRAWVDRPRGA